MRLERSKAWWMAKAATEGDGLIAAGAPELRPSEEGGSSESEAPGVGSVAASMIDEAHLAFGRFVNLMRRRRGLTVDAFATEVQIDASELLIIEDDVRYVPMPRTVYRLAVAFGVPQARLLQLAGLAETKDASLRYEAVRFAASADPVKQLSNEEKAALETFVAVLSRIDPTKGK